MFRNIIIYIIVGIIVSMYFFPVSFTFLPAFINSKNTCALFGVIVSVFHALQNKRVSINKDTLGAIIIVIIYSLVGYFAVDFNNTADYSYANYFVSFAVWTFGAYFVCAVILFAHGDVNIRLIATYLAYVAFAQCILAILISEFPGFKNLVDTYIDQGQDFLMKVSRWYGIGASLDSGGVRFCIILVLIVGIIIQEEEVRKSKWYITSLLVCFATIVLIGNIISRTTSVGAIMALAYLLIKNSMIRKYINYDTLKINLIFGGIILLAAAIGVYLYRTDESFYLNFRFAFEGFFNWVEKGEWSTASTDKLNAEMWVWPEDAKTWIIGSGLFDGWIYRTDIGYCRHILYNGVIGLSVFSLLFIYCFVVSTLRYRNYGLIFFLLLSLGFIIWIKVSTDIYQIWAMLFVLTYLENKNKLVEGNVVVD